jgi:hypothetical protein
MTATPAPYEEVTDAAFAAAAATFDLSEVIGGVVLRGACPRCDDTMEFFWVDDAIRGVGGGPAVPAGPDEDVRIINMLCTCAVAHPGRAPDGMGCGAYWNLTLEG